MAKFQPEWNNGAAAEEARTAASRVLTIVKESATADTITYHRLYHSEAVRATTLLLQILLRTGQQELADRTNEVTQTCRAGIALCRSLVPSFLAKAEDTIEAILDRYLPSYNGISYGSRHLERMAAAPLPEPVGPQMYIENGPADTSTFPSQVALRDSFPFSFPFDDQPIDQLFYENHHAVATPSAQFDFSFTYSIPFSSLLIRRLFENLPTV
jgi:hypothetical protein